MTNGKFASDILTEPTLVAVSNSLATGRCYNLKIINAVPVNNKSDFSYLISDQSVY